MAEFPLFLECRARLHDTTMCSWDIFAEVLRSDSLVIALLIRVAIVATRHRRRLPAFATKRIDLN